MFVVSCGLKNGLAVKLDAEPTQIFDDATGIVLNDAVDGLPVRCDILLVGILDAHEEFASVLFGVEKIVKRRAGTAKVQPPCGAWGKSYTDVHRISRMRNFDSVLITQK